MTQYVTVVPGVNLSRDLAEFTKGRNRVTKTWVRYAMRAHPEWDWRIVNGPYVNAEDAIRHDLTLQVVDPRDVGTVKAMVTFGVVKVTGNAVAPGTTEVRAVVR